MYQMQFYSQIEYPADRTIPVLITRPVIGLIWNVPTKLMNSPTRLIVLGVAILAMVNMKYIVANKGIDSTIPL